MGEGRVGGVVVNPVLGSPGVRAQEAKGSGGRDWRPEVWEGVLRIGPELGDRRSPDFQRRWGVG